MLSIVISSYREDFYTGLVQNIAITIGKNLEYELIRIENKNKMSVCEAYNKGKQLSQYPYVLFLHEDIHFNSVDWGYTLLRLFDANEKIGLIGIAGAMFKSKAPSAWWETEEKHKFIYIRHGTRENNELMKFGFSDEAPANPVRVLSIDGVFIGLRKSTGLRFNEQLKGYHQYDLGISMDAYINGHHTICTNLVDITHYSMGHLDKSWVESADHFTRLYSKHLPAGIEFPNKKSITKLEAKNYADFIAQALKNNSKHLAWKYWFKLVRLKPFSSNSYKMLKRLLRQSQIARQPLQQ